MDFLHLWNAEIDPGQGPRAINTEGKTPTEEGVALRVFRDGSVYASKEFADSFNIEYQNKDIEEQYGLDVVRTDKWGAYNSSHHFILVGKIERNNPKIDLFGTTRKYNENGNPEISVTTQGSKSFGKELLEMLNDVYGYELPEDKAFVDLQVHTEQGMLKSPNNIYNLPKKIMKGDKAGEWTTVRREGIILYPMTVHEANTNETNENNENNEITVGENTEEELWNKDLGTEFKSN